MAPAAHLHHHQHHRNAITVTHIEHNEAYDVTSLYKIMVPTTLACSLPHPNSHSLPPPPLPPLQTSPSTPKLTPAASPPPPQDTTSNYPRPSPPTFLYPEPIVPPQVYEVTMQRHRPPCSTQPPHLRLTTRSNNSSWTMPVWLTVLMLVVIAVAAAWSVVVCLIHYRGVTTGMAARRRVGEKGERKGRWRKRVVRTFRFAKGAGRYEELQSEDEGSSGVELRTGGRTSAHDLCVDPPFRTRSLATPFFSPYNPYLVPPDAPLCQTVRPRGSVEWADEHRAFFSGGTSTSLRSPAARSRGSSSTHSLSSAEVEDIESEAREAQGRRASHARVVENELPPHSERVSWVDLGLAMVDGAVDRAAAKIVRWADDGGADEGLVLPLAKSKSD